MTHPLARCVRCNHPLAGDPTATPTGDHLVRMETPLRIGLDPSRRSDANHVTMTATQAVRFAWCSTIPRPVKETHVPDEPDKTIHPQSQTGPTPDDEDALVASSLPEWDVTTMHALGGMPTDQRVRAATADDARAQVPADRIIVSVRAVPAALEPERQENGRTYDAMLRAAFDAGVIQGREPYGPDDEAFQGWRASFLPDPEPEPVPGGVLKTPAEVRAAIGMTTLAEAARRSRKGRA